MCTPEYLFPISGNKACNDRVAIIAPIIWNKMYPIPSLTPIFFVIIIGIVTAGLICAPETCPNAYTIKTIIPP